jgi:hypothetical protein
MAHGDLRPANLALIERSGSQEMWLAGAELGLLSFWTAGEHVEQDTEFVSAHHCHS